MSDGGSTIIASAQIGSPRWCWARNAWSAFPYHYTQKVTQPPSMHPRARQGGKDGTSTFGKKRDEIDRRTVYLVVTIAVLLNSRRQRLNPKIYTPGQSRTRLAFVQTCTPGSFVLSDNCCPFSDASEIFSFFFFLFFSLSRLFFTMGSGQKSLMDLAIRVPLLGGIGGIRRPSGLRGNDRIAPTHRTSQKCELVNMTMLRGWQWCSLSRGGSPRLEQLGARVRPKNRPKNRYQCQQR